MLTLSVAEYFCCKESSGAKRCESLPAPTTPDMCHFNLRSNTSPGLRVMGVGVQHVVNDQIVGPVKGPPGAVVQTAAHAELNSSRDGRL